MASDAENTTWEAVPQYEDGQPVNAATLNGPIANLAARTDHLLRLLQQNDRTKVVVDATLSDPDRYGYPKLGQPVYRTSGGSYAKAIGATAENAWFYADSRAMVVGVVGSTSGEASGTVVLCGYLSLGKGVDVADLIDPRADPSPVSGRYYLSNHVAGMLTSNPSGPVIYACDCHIENGKVMSMLVNPQYRDTGESHVHRSFVLRGMPQGGYAIKGVSMYSILGLIPKDAAGNQILPDSSDGLPYGALTLQLFGTWQSADSVEYTLSVRKKDGAPATSSDWGDYEVFWTGGGESGTIDLGNLKNAQGNVPRRSVYSAACGSIGLIARFMTVEPTTGSPNSPDPSKVLGQTWTFTMPDAAQCWLTSGSTVKNGTFVLNLGMYPEITPYVPPAPENGVAFIVDGLEMRSPQFGETDANNVDSGQRQWYISNASAMGGPWLYWVGRHVLAGDSLNTPFKWVAQDSPCTPRPMLLQLNRMKVGSTGFVTSLQAAPGSPLRVTSAQTGATAVQGALQIGLDVDFKSSAGNVAGSQVVKRINGTTFETGPVVERIVAGPGLAVNREQGIVSVSVSNAVYSGDFETIALKNAKQDLAGGVFPYTKLLGPGIASGFTAKFRVPDNLPYKRYQIVVSASVFGELGVSDATMASFMLANSILSDQACAVASTNGGTVLASAPVAGSPAVVGVPFSASYKAYDPILIHGFRASEDGTGPYPVLTDTPGHRISDGGLWLKDKYGNPAMVYPGYFVGIEITRCATDGAEYTAPIGFLSLRWNLVEAPAS